MPVGQIRAVIPAPGTPAAARGIIGFVGVQLVGALAAASTPPLRKGGIASSVGAISGLS